MAAAMTVGWCVKGTREMTRSCVALWEEVTSRERVVVPGSREARAWADGFIFLWFISACSSLIDGMTHR